MLRVPQGAIRFGDDTTHGVSDPRSSEATSEADPEGQPKSEAEVHVSVLSERSTFGSVPKQVATRQAGGIQVDGIFTAMEARKMRRRWCGYRTQSEFSTPLFWILVIHLVPYFIPHLYVHHPYLFSCDSGGGRKRPCTYRDVNLTCLAAGIPPQAFDISTGSELNTDAVHEYFAVRWYDILTDSGRFGVSVVLLYFIGAVWVFRWWLYASVILSSSWRVFSGYCEGECEEANAAYAWLSILITFCMPFVLLISALMMSFVMPLAAEKGWLRFRNVTASYNIRPVAAVSEPSGRVTYQFQYTPSSLPIIVPFWNCSWLSSLVGGGLFSYSGELDEHGRPHGFGRWRDSQRKGETLKGLWRRGVPIGPFVASEQGNGYGFRCVQIGFATCCADAQEWRMGGCSTQLGELQWGIAATETVIDSPSTTHLCHPDSNPDPHGNSQPAHNGHKHRDHTPDLGPEPTPTSERRASTAPSTRTCPTPSSGSCRRPVEALRGCSLT